MKITTIQITKGEDQEIAQLKVRLGLPSKKAVLLEGMRLLREKIKGDARRRHLRKVVLAIREESQRVNREWAPGASAVHLNED